MGVNESINRQIELAKRVRAAALELELQRIAIIINRLTTQEVTACSI
jgi:CO dehydrogenase nickel-insertion accessory protein CooC1